MAQSRLEKIGTIFTRVTGLLRTSAMKPEDKPIWYDVYAAFPPKREPRFDRPIEDVPIKNIFYAEDLVRARYQKTVKQLETVHLAELRRATQTQQFIEILNNFKAQGALDDENVFEVALETLSKQNQQLQQRASAPSSDGLLKSFTEAHTESNRDSGASTSTTVDIQKIFKD